MLFAKVDVLLAPCTPDVAPRIGQKMMMLGNAAVPTRPNIGLYTQPISFIGLPVVAVPLWSARGLPIGVQVIAPAWAEDTGPAGGRRPGAARYRLLTASQLMIVNDPETLAALSVAFARYERALMHNELEVLDSLFWESERTVRFGVGENLYGIAAIREFRSHRPGGSPPRVLHRTVITTFGADYGTANTEFVRERLHAHRPPEPELGAHGGGLAHRRCARLHDGAVLVARTEPPKISAAQGISLDASGHQGKNTAHAMGSRGGLKLGMQPRGHSILVVCRSEPPGSKLCFQ